MLWPLEQLLQPVVFLFFFASLVDNLSLALGGFWAKGAPRHLPRFPTPLLTCIEIEPFQDALDGRQGMVWYGMVGSTVCSPQGHNGIHRLSVAYNGIRLEFETKLFSFLLLRSSTCNFGLERIDE